MTVLVVDDDKKIHELLTITLQGEFRVLTASDGETALAAAREHRPDLILMDVDMPRLDGITACRRLKADPQFRHVPVFIVTGLDDNDRRRQVGEAGADALITKPFSPLAVLSRVRGALNRQ